MPFATPLPVDPASLTGPAPLTNHALVRARQRGIDLEALACLLGYGRHAPSAYFVTQADRPA